MDWFKQAKYGLFIHFGLYALLGGEYKGQVNRGNAEWILNDLNIPLEEYEKLAEEFRPDSFDGEKIARYAKEWGMGYIVFTAKHHDGYALYDSAVSDFTSAKSPRCKRDLVRELQEACQRNGLKLGLYYSQSQDWHDPDGYRYRSDNSGKSFSNYLQRKCLPQIRELLNNYGELGLMWFDTPMDMTREESREIVSLVKSIQPQCLINGRIGHGLGEYLTMGDNYIPRLPISSSWEVPATLNDTWGFSKRDRKWKDERIIIKNLIKIAGRGGNYLLNVGPDGSGAIPEESIRILGAAGRYLKENGEGIYGCETMPFYPYELSWGDLTCRKHFLYIHVFEPKKVVEILNMKAEITEAILLGTGEPLVFSSMKSCEADWMLRFEIPESLYQTSGYCIRAAIREEYPVMEPIREVGEG